MPKISFLSMIILSLTALFLAACNPSGSEPVTTQTQSTQVPDIGALVPSGSPEIRDLDPTTEAVSNCGGISEPVVKHPSMTTVTVHNVEWEVGGSVGVGLTVGEGVIPGGVNLEGVLERQVSNEIGSQVQQSNAWDLPAEPGYIMEYTLMWREVWQSGYVDVKFLDPAPRIERINLKYRTGIQSEIIGQKPTLCDPQLVLPEDTDAEPLSPSQDQGSGVESPQSEVDDSVDESVQPSGINAATLNELFGSENWFCFPDRTNGIGVKLLPVNFTVAEPLRYIDTFRGRFTVGDTELGSTGATAELTSALPKSRCPTWQQAALDGWAAARSNTSQISSGTQLDSLFGQGNWGCLSDYPFGARVYYLNSNLNVEYPFSTVDVYDGTKRGVGETVAPGGEITVWFAGAIPRDQCP